MEDEKLDVKRWREPCEPQQYSGAREAPEFQASLSEEEASVRQRSGGQAEQRDSRGRGDKKRSGKNRRSFWRGFLAGFLAGVLFVLVGAVIAAAVFLWLLGSGYSEDSGAAGKKGEITVATVSEPNPEHLDYAEIIGKIERLQQLISRNYLFDEDPQAVEDGIYAGMLRGLGDPYTVYYTEEEFEKLNEETSGTYSGIGAVLSKDPNTGICTVMSVFSGSPAEEAGLREGDILYTVDGYEVTGADLDYFVTTYVRGPEGTAAEIVVLRGESHEEITMQVTRRSIDVPTVEYEMKEDGIAYLRIIQFDVVTPEQFQTAIEALSAQGMKKLVIDLRNNPGGVVQSAVQMLDYMLPDGMLVYTAGRAGVGDRYYSSDGHELDIPTVLLINGNSASSAEIFAGAYRDFGRAKLVGTTTFGKGIVQFVLPLGDGSAIKITTQHYYTPKGFDLHGKGIAPDVELEPGENDSMNGESDVQLERAVEILKNE